MSIAVYKMRRRPGTDRETWTGLCPKHAEARKVLGYELREQRNAHLTACDDCRERGSVLEAAIAEADAAARAGEPEPVRVLPGQRSLFPGGDE